MTKPKTVHALLVPPNGETYHLLCEEEAYNKPDAQSIANEVLADEIERRGLPRREWVCHLMHGSYWVLCFTTR